MRVGYTTYSNSSIFRLTFRCSAFFSRFIGTVCACVCVCCMMDNPDSMEPLWEGHGRRLSEAGLRRGSGNVSFIVGYRR